MAEAESSVHGCEVNDVHFHEIGSIETLINIVGVSSAIDYFKPNKIYCMPPPMGSGNVKTSHGILPIPVPVVSEIAMRNQIPLYGGEAFPYGELTTPTAIALISFFVDRYQQPACLEVLSIGVGLGKKDLKRSNLLRLYEIEKSLIEDADKLNSYLYWQELIKQEAWIDDATPEDISELVNQLRNAGAIDVICHSVQMKKGRQGVHVQAIVDLKFVKEVRLIWFSKSTTIGLRGTWRVQMWSS